MLINIQVILFDSLFLWIIFIVKYFIGSAIKKL